VGPTEWLEILLMRRGDDAVTFIEWLLHGTMPENYASANPFIDVMIAPVRRSEHRRLQRVGHRRQLSLRGEED
jgi:hypothetical protein